VKICVTDDALDILENHAPDPTVSRPDSQVNPDEQPPLEEENKN